LAKTSVINYHLTPRRKPDISNVRKSVHTAVMLARAILLLSCLKNRKTQKYTELDTCNFISFGTSVPNVFQL
jgi:hypothetical protein